MASLSEQECRCLAHRLFDGEITPEELRERMNRQTAFDFGAGACGPRETEPGAIVGARARQP